MQETEAEIGRLSAMSPEDFMSAVVQYVTLGAARDTAGDARGAALASPQLAPRVLDALGLAVKRARTFVPLREGESKPQQASRVAVFRATVQAAMRPYQDIVDDLAHEKAKQLAALDDETFARHWTAFVNNATSEEPASRVLALAFRSPRAATRAAALCHVMQEDPARFLPAPTDNSSRKAQAVKVAQFRERVSAEAAFLRYSIQYAEARHGRMPGEPNVRLRALRRLGEQHPEDLSRYLREVREELEEARRQVRRDKRAIRRTGLPVAAAPPDSPGR